MKNFQEKNKKRKLIHSFPVLFLLSVLFVFFVIGVFSLFFKMQNTTENRRIAGEKLKNLEERKSNLLLDIDQLTTSKGKEKIFRENYGFAKEGEGVVVIIDDKNLVENPKEVTNKGFLKDFFDFFR